MCGLPLTRLGGLTGGDGSQLGREGFKVLIPHAGCTLQARLVIYKGATCYTDVLRTIIGHMLAYNPVSLNIVNTPVIMNGITGEAMLPVNLASYI